MEKSKDGRDQIIQVDQPGTYSVILTNAQCILSDTIIIDGTVGGGIVYAPNSFTPNRDNLNDIFLPKGDNITEYHLMIFNRWGQCIFESNDINNGWNGTYQDRPVQEDTYVCVIKYHSSCSGEFEVRKIAHVTLIR
jgi:gliding motility-associated-like protein